MTTLRLLLWSGKQLRFETTAAVSRTNGRTEPVQNSADDMKSEKIAALLRFFFFFISCFAVTIKVRKSSSDMFHPLMLTNVLVEIK